MNHHSILTATFLLCVILLGSVSSHSEAQWAIHHSDDSGEQPHKPIRSDPSDLGVPQMIKRPQYDTKQSGPSDPEEPPIIRRPPYETKRSGPSDPGELPIIRRPPYETKRSGPSDPENPPIKRPSYEVKRGRVPGPNPPMPNLPPPS